MLNRITLVGALLIAASACGTPVQDTADAKPVADPDAAVAGKADGLSNHFTTRMGELPMDDLVEGAIGYPDWFHGYTIDLEAGQTMQFTTWADAQGVVRLYGPARGESDRLRYGQPAVRSYAAPRGYRSQSEFTFEVEEGGTYMLVYGPYYVWDSDYELSTKCLGGCEVDPPTSECATHDDCGEGTFCRQLDWDADSGRECVPYEQEGDGCGGFVPPHMVRACSPELSCVFRPFIADAPGTCRNVATVDEIAANPTDYDGMRVSIDGYVNIGPAICTQMACTPDDPCCNSCGASQVLADTESAFDGIDLMKDGETMGCGGDSCDYVDNCGLDATGKTRVVGRVEVGGFGTTTLHIEEMTALEHL